MRKIRCFIAINLSEEIKEKLQEIQFIFPEIPIKWTKKENLHITLLFLGDVNKEKIPEIEKMIEESVLNVPSFDINILETLYSPESLEVPNMIWAKVEESEHLKKINENLRIRIGDLKVGFNKREKFVPHVTLGKIKKWEFGQIGMENLPEIKKELFLNSQIHSVELMESKLGRGGSRYSIIKSFPFNKL